MKNTEKNVEKNTEKKLLGSSLEIEQYLNEIKDTFLTLENKPKFVVEIVE